MLINPEPVAQLKTLLVRYGPQLTLRALAAACIDQLMLAAKSDVRYAKLWLRISTELETIAGSIESEDR